MVFQSTDVGPFWMTRQQREANRFDQETGETKVRKRLKAELKAELISRSINCGKKNLQELQNICNGFGIPTSEEIAVVKQGWEGKPKGLLQILWERGLVDANKLDTYTMKGKTDELGNIINNTSLIYLMANCTDFANEETLLQHKGREMGVLVDRTPKCHPELAGEGIEYTWGCSKGYYRRLPIQRKRGLQNFKSSVQLSMSADVLSKSRVRKFARRARRYICAYFALAKGVVGGVEHNDGAIQEGEPLQLQEIERVVKLFKTHRCALYFDGGFIEETFCEQTETNTSACQIVTTYIVMN